MISESELKFLLSHVGPADSVWEWGSGRSTFAIASKVRHITTVEHDPSWAIKVMAQARPNVSVLHYPPDLPFDNATDGDGETFASYVAAYSGLGINAVLIDGRARVACARRVGETAPFGPNPGMRIFLHDCEREEYAPIMSYFLPKATEGRLMLLGPRL